MDIQYDNELDCYVLNHNGEITALGAANYEEAVIEAQDFIAYLVH